MKSGTLSLLEPSGPVQGYNGIVLPFFLPEGLDWLCSPVQKVRGLFAQDGGGGGEESGSKIAGA
jgi:hypothetical protein